MRKLGSGTVSGKSALVDVLFSQQKRLVVERQKYYILYTRRQLLWLQKEVRACRNNLEKGPYFSIDLWPQ